MLRKLGGAFAVNVGGTAMAFGVQVLLARLLGADDFGDYIYAVTWMTLILLLGKLGIDTVSLRLIPHYRVTQQWGLLRGFIRRSKQAVLLASVASGLCAAGVVAVLHDSITGDLYHVLLLGCLLIPFSAYMMINAAHLQSLHFIVAAQAPQVLLRPALITVGVLGAWALFPGPVSASVAMLLNIMASFGVIMVLAYFARRRIPAETAHAKPEFLTGPWARMSVSMMLITSFTMVLNQTDVLMVGGMLSTRDAGLYSAAARVATFLTFAINLVNSIAAPLMSKLYSEGDTRRLQEMINRVAWGSFVFATPMFIGILVFSDNIMAVFGPDFVSGSTALIVLGAARWIAAMTGAAGYLMSMSGHERPAARILGISAVVNLVLNAILVKPYGMNGAAAATLVTTVLWTGLMVAYGRRYIGVNPCLSLRAL